jgi:predicted RNA-binding protein with PIN domain
VARRGLSDDPPVVPPAGLRRYLAFTRLSAAALQAIARVVDNDDGFRARVAAEVDEAVVGRAGWLWLTRPEGYLDDLHKLEEDADAAAAAASADREERDARRRLAATQSAAERAMAAARVQAQEIDDLRAELLDERNRRSESEARLAEVDDELDRVRAERARAVRELKDIETRLADRAAELRQLKAQLRALEAERDRADAEPEPAEGTDAIPVVTATSVWPPESEPPPPSPLPPAVDPVALTQALRSAARGAAELARALGDIEAVVAALRPDHDVDALGDGTSVAAAGEAGNSAGRHGGPPVRAGEALARVAERDPAPARRVPLPLPGGLLDDSVEAVEHLLRAPGILLLVDGYNVTMTGWPELPVGEQRRRLLGALGETAARTGAAVEVVFDGAAVEPLSPPHQVRQLVRVRFSPPDVEADDVLLDLLAQLPVARPVAVASSDNRVRDGARRQGANLVHARQLVGLLRR